MNFIRLDAGGGGGEKSQDNDVEGNSTHHLIMNSLAEKSSISKASTKRRL